MSTFSISRQNPLIRCITAAAMFFCTLVPNIAVCRCADCNCCGKTEVEHSGKEESGCCSQKKTAEETLPACCRNTGTDCDDKGYADKNTGKQKSSHNGCPCLLKANEKAPAVVEKTALVNNPLLLCQFFSEVPALTGIVFDVPCTFASILLFYWENSAAPPLRLHLLLQVLVI